MPPDCNPARVTGTVTADANPGILAERCRGLAVGLAIRAGRLERLRTKQPPTAIALANGGQKRSWSAKSAACFAELLRPKTDRGGHTRTQPCCSGRLFAKTAKADWRRTVDKGGQNGGSGSEGPPWRLRSVLPASLALQACVVSSVEAGWYARCYMHSTGQAFASKLGSRQLVMQVVMHRSWSKSSQ
jgi:hypothetical protein